MKNQQAFHKSFTQFRQLIAMKAPTVLIANTAVSMAKLVLFDAPSDMELVKYLLDRMKNDCEYRAKLQDPESAEAKGWSEIEKMMDDIEVEDSLENFRVSKGVESSW